MEDAAVELDVWSAHHAAAFAQQFRQNHLQVPFSSALWLIIKT
jgi:hypothetical protein